MLKSIESNSVESVQKYSLEVLLGSYEDTTPQLIELPPGIDKTNLIFELYNQVDTPITYLTSRSNTYDRLQKRSEWDLNSCAVIPSPFRDCPTFRGDNDGDELQAKRLYRKGVSAREIHNIDSIETPCDSIARGVVCPYIKAKNEINNHLSRDSIDLLVGGHKHAFRPDNIHGRTVVIEGFDPDNFLEHFPRSDRDIQTEPKAIISEFIRHLDDVQADFPTDVYEDFTDLIVHRTNEDALEQALIWFEENGATWNDARKLDLFDTGSLSYGSGHLYAPMLTLSLLCMRKVGSGFELAPSPKTHEESRIRTAWRNSGLGPIRCLRDRNSGKMYLLQLPDFHHADHIIGIDELPANPFWDLLMTTTSFEQSSILQRDLVSEYLRSILNTDIIQIGKGMHPYSGGRISDDDGRRFAAIKTIEGEKFSLVSTANAINEYRERGWLEPFIAEGDESQRNTDDSFSTVNFAAIPGTNDLKGTSLGVVSGAPFPGYEVMRIWLGLLGNQADFSGRIGDNNFEGTTKMVFDYLTGHRVVRAISSFIPDDSAQEIGERTVYVNTTALPEWFEPHSNIQVEFNTKRSRIIEFMIHANRSESKYPLADQNVASLEEHLSIDGSYIREVLNSLVEKGVVSTRDGGRGGSMLYRWTGDDYLVPTDYLLDTTHALESKNTIFLLNIG